MQTDIIYGIFKTVYTVKKMLLFFGQGGSFYQIQATDGRKYRRRQIVVQCKWCSPAVAQLCFVVVVVDGRLWRIVVIVKYGNVIFVVIIIDAQ